MKGSDSEGFVPGRETQWEGNARFNFTGDTAHTTEAEGWPPVPTANQLSPLLPKTLSEQTRVIDVALYSLPCWAFWF